jgi:hypothetical protein
MRKLITLNLSFLLLALTSLARVESGPGLTIHPHLTSPNCIDKYSSDTLPVGQFSLINIIDTISPTAAPQLVFEGYRQHWRMGLDVSNNGGGGDLALVSQDIPNSGNRELIYVNTNKTGNNTISDTSGDPTMSFFITPADSNIQTLFNVSDRHPNRPVVGIRTSQYTTSSGNYLAFYTSAGLTTPVMALNSSLEFTPFLKCLGPLSVLSSNVSSTNYLDLNANPSDNSTDILLKDYYNSGTGYYYFLITNHAQTANYLVINQSTGNVGINCANPGSQLTVNGTVESVAISTGSLDCSNLKINKVTNWADYVFDKDYRLMPLSAVGKYINQYRHLPDVPSQQEVSKNGIDMAKMQEVLLRKVEELTLYAIDQDKKLSKLEAQDEKITAMQKKLEDLKKNSKK